jgi:tetratricopeptide (TPR) repeat protein
MHYRQRVGEQAMQVPRQGEYEVSPLNTYASTIALILVLLPAVPGFPAQATPAQNPAAPDPQSEIDRISREAQSAYGKGDWTNAIRGYEGLLKVAPGVADYYLNLGIAYHASGRPLDAVRPLRQALKLKPGLTQARAYLGISLSETGQCVEALPYLKKDLIRVGDREVRRNVGLAGIKCAVALARLDEAVDFIRALNRDFSADPEVLYQAAHVYSDLSTKASMDLLNKSPSSYQVRLLSAEALEAQGNWEGAAKEYRVVLEKNPSLPGIHYRLGRIILSAPKTDTTMQDARKEFEAELKIDPTNAGAEFVLGKLTLDPATLDEAIGHFSRAVQLDASFAEGYVELGNALILADRAAEAVKPLETAVKLQPGNPLPHFRLSNAYNRLGKKEDAQRELALYKELSEKIRQHTESVQKAVSGIAEEKPD